MNINDVLHGFRLDRIRKSEETSSTAHYFTHEKTGAQLLFLKNDDKNRAFGIGFKTPPEDQTGVPHIVEHCVLSGSRKYKTREPFMDLLKGSMQTFLNAMTFDDMTIYPISSMNEKDYFNLMGVYLDAVFYPVMYEKKEIFMQEGWHYELNSKEDEITYKGVVYNEMRGAYSSQERQVINSLMTELHQGTTYSVESGGYPYNIPELTYENFLKFHKDHYHPTNSLVFLYGDVDLEKALSLIGDEYLDSFTRSDAKIELNLNENVKGRRTIERFYAGDKDADDKKNAYLAYILNHGNNDDLTDIFMNAILSEILVNSESSPIRRALLEKGIGEDVFGFESDTYFKDFGIIAKNTDAARLSEFTDIIENTMKDIVKNGFNRDLLLASINKTEFSLRESRGSLRGILYFISAMSSWRYGGDPMTSLSYFEEFEKFRKGIDEGLFEKYLNDRLLNSDNSVIAVFRPQSDLFLKKDEKLREDLKAYKASLSEKEIEDLIEENRKLSLYQKTEDSPEDKATIPHLSLSDITKDIPEFIYETQEAADAKISFHERSTNGISYVTYAFPLEFMKNEEDLFIVSTMSKFLGIFDTKKHSYIDLNNEILKYTNGISAGVGIFGDSKIRQEYSLRFLVTSSAIGNNSEKMSQYIREVLLETLFTDKKRLKEVLTQIKSEMEMNFDFRGNELVMHRVKSAFDLPEYIRENLTGLEYYDRLSDFLSHFDEKADSFIASCEDMYKRVINRKGLDVFITSEKSMKENLIKEARETVMSFEDHDEVKETIEFKKHSLKEGITSASGVQYVSTGNNLKDLGFEYDGRLQVLTGLLSNDYLHTRIRAQGGAYGAGIYIDRAGNTVTNSYRDPNLENTVDVYKKIGDFLREGTFTEDDIRDCIIGTMTKFMPPVSSSAVNYIHMGRLYSNVSTDDIMKDLDAALSVTREDIMSFADMMDKLTDGTYLSVFGNVEKINKSKDMFDSVRQLKKQAGN